MKHFFAALFFALSLAFHPNHAHAKDKIENFNQAFTACSDAFEKSEQECPELWSMRCFDHLMAAHKTVQQCYKNIAVKLFNEYYGLSVTDAENRFDEYNKFIYDEYIFIFAETNSCKKENCGVSVDLYAEYAATQELHHYINKIIGSISARL